MKIIGLTGGIGSGKSTVASAFKKLGIPIFIADESSKTILNTHPDAISSIKELLGDQAYTINQNGTTIADRKYIASQVFNNQEQLQRINEILHPLVREDFKQWLSHQHSPFIIYEAAILFESGSDKYCDEVILVWAKKEERIARVVKRDGVSEDEVRQRLQNQWTDSQKLQKANYVIVNEDLQLIDRFARNFREIMLNNRL